MPMAHTSPLLSDFADGPDVDDRRRDAQAIEEDEAEDRRLWQEDDVEFDRVLELWRSL